MNGEVLAREPFRRVRLPRRRTAGFTLVELVTILVVAAILAAIAAPRFFNRLSFEERGFRDQSIAAVRYAQRVAIAERRNVFVVIGENQLQLCYDAGCATPLLNPGMGTAFDITTPDGVSLAPEGTISFNGLGQPAAVLPLTLPLTVTVGGADNMTFIVQQETGYVLQP